jgi:hypothetical protein
MFAFMARSAGPITKSTIDALLASAKKRGATAVDVTLPRGVTSRVYFQPVEVQQSTAPAPTLDEEPEVVL